ncbi:hypothetical protein V8F33_001697 [Rhypophila sp. PSN 637]
MLFSSSRSSCEAVHDSPYLSLPVLLSLPTIHHAHPFCLSHLFGISNVGVARPAYALFLARTDFLHLHGMMDFVCSGKATRLPGSQDKTPEDSQFPWKSGTLLISNDSSNSKMYSTHYDSVTTSGPLRRVDLAYRSHELYPSSQTTAPQRTQSHSRGKRSRKEARPKSRTPSAEKIQTEAPKSENLPEFTLRARQLPDGTYPFPQFPVCYCSDSSTGNWEYFYQLSDHAARQETVAKRDIYDPSTYLPMPGVGGVDDWQPPDVQPAVEAEVEVRISDDGGEYGVQNEYTNASGLGQPLVNIESGAVDWDHEQQIQQQETSGYHSQHSADYDQTYYNKPKHRHATNKQKRRDSFTTPTQKLPFMQRFLFPEKSREAMKLGKMRNNRVDVWLRNVPLEVAADLVYQGQYYAGHGKYQTTTEY